jgi:hypothetical protein
MQNKLKIYATSISIILFVIVASFVLQRQISGEQFTSKVNSHPTPNGIDEFKKDFPKVDYINDRLIDPERQKRSEKYSKIPVLNPDSTENNQETVFLDWANNLPVLPVKESEVILVAKVIDAEAYLSSNKKSVYSEFTLQVEKEFKNTSARFSSVDKTLEVERDGGLVRYPSGFETLYFVDGQRMPKISKRYVFFLTHQFPLYGFKKDDLYLLTAYQLEDGKVTPLDDPGGGTHKMATAYRDKSENVLLNDLREAIEKISSNN